MGNSSPNLNKLQNRQPIDRLKIGMINTGNWCYVISILQTLYYLDKFKSSLYREEIKDNWVLEAIKKAFDEIEDASKSIKTTISIDEFMRVLGEKNEMYNAKDQQDCQELFNYLMNTANDFICKSKTDSSKPSWIEDLFRGQTVNTIECSCCQKVTTNSDPFFELQVDLTHRKSLNRCIELMSTEEEMKDKDQFFCDTCNKKVNATKRNQISVLPFYLVVQLKIFEYDDKQHIMKKSGHFVPFAEKLSLSTKDDEINKYRLKSVIVHLGQNLHFGHYIALIRHNNKWLKYNDERVDIFDEMTMHQIYGGLSKQTCAYVLFYEKIDN